MQLIYKRKMKKIEKATHVLLRSPCRQRGFSHINIIDSNIAINSISSSASDMLTELHVS